MITSKRIGRLLLIVGLMFSLIVPVNSVLAEGPSDPAPVLQPVGAPNGKTVLFDNAHGQTAGAADWVIDGAFSDFALALAKEGYHVKELRKKEPIALDDLQNADVFVIPEANIPFKTSEQQAMAQYVDNGGSIFFIADHYNADRNKNRWDASEVFNGYRRGAWQDPAAGMSVEERQSAAMQNVSSSDWLADNFGIRIRYNALGDINSDHIVPSPQAFGITENVKTVTMHAGSTLAIIDPTKAKGIVYIAATNKAWPNAVDQGVYNGGGLAEGPYAAIAKAGLGKAAVIGDSSPVEDSTPKYLREENGAAKKTYDGFYERDNDKLLVNIVNWLSVKESYTSLTQVPGLTLDQPTALLAQESPQSSVEPKPEPWASPASGFKWWDPSTFKQGSYGYDSSSPGEPPTGDGEGFESGSKGTYAAGNVTLDSGLWLFDNALIGDLPNDKKNEAKSARIRAAGFIAMNDDVEGAGSVTLQHANFGNDSGAVWKLQKSTDGGSTWSDVGESYSSGASLANKTIEVNEMGAVRFKIAVAGVSGKRINIDNFQINR